MSRNKKKNKKDKKHKRGDSYAPGSAAGTVFGATASRAGTADELLERFATTTGATLGSLVNTLEQLDASRREVLERLTALQSEINGYVERFGASMGGARTPPTEADVPQEARGDSAPRRRKPATGKTTRTTPVRR
jgi:hypothetical protein